MVLKVIGLHQIAVLSACFLSVSFLSAQDSAVSTIGGSQSVASLRRFEVGSQFTDMRVAQCFGYRACDVPQFGLGVGATLNITQHYAIDSTFNILPGVYNFNSMGGLPGNGSIEGGRLSSLLVGARAEARAKRYGFFADAKPGFISWSYVPTGFSSVPPSNGHPNYTYGRRIYFATNVGGGIEYSPRERVHIRVDMGDLLVRYMGTPFTLCNTCGSWTQNLQTTAGVYVGVGKPFSWNPPAINPATTHRFFNKSNLALMGISLLGQAADAVTTQRFTSRGFQEEDPFALSLVKYGWSGQIGLAVITNVAEITVMYGLHKMGKHSIERVLPLAVATASAAAAYNNDQFSYSK